MSDEATRRARRIAQLKEEAAQVARLVAQQERLAERGEASVAVQDALAENTEKYKERILELIKTTGDLSLLTAEQVARLNEWNVSTTNAGAATAELNESIKQGQERLKEYNEIQEDAIQSGLSFLGFSKDLVKQQKVMSQRFEQIGTNIKKMGALKYMGELGKQVFAGMAAKGQELVMMMFSLAFSVDTATSAFKKQTGIVEGKYIRAIEASYERNRRFGVTAEMASQAQGALTQGVTDYMFAAPAAQDAMMDTTEIFAAQGIAVEDTAAAMQTSMKMLGETGTQAAVTAREIKSFAQEIGMAPQAVLKNFAAAGPALAKLGGDAKQTFKELQVQARLTGLSVERMLDITSQFDTFEGAATAAGKMNAMLGGPFVSALEMIEATDPVERFDKLRGSLDAAGKDFETMGYYEKIAIAEAMGLKDVGELALVMRGRTDLLAGASQKSAESIEAEAEQAAKMQDVMTQLKAIFTEMAPVFMDLINLYLRPLAEWFRDNIELVRAFGHVLMWAFAGRMLFGAAAGIFKLGRGLAGLAKGAKAAKTAGNIITGPTGMMGGMMGGTGTRLLGILAGLAALIWTIGKALEASDGGKGMMDFAIGLGVLLAAITAMAMVFSKFVTLEKSFIMMTGGIALLVASFALMFKFATPEMLQSMIDFGLGFALVVGVIMAAAATFVATEGLMAAAFGALVLGFGALAWALGHVFEKLGTGTGVKALSDFLTLPWTNLNVIDALALIGFLNALGPSIQKLDEGAGLESLGKLVEASSDFEKLGQTFDGLSTSFESFLSIATPAAVSQILSLAGAFQGLGAAMNTVGELGPLKIEVEPIEGGGAGEAGETSAISRQQKKLMGQMEKLVEAIKDIPAPLGGTVAVPIGANKIKVSEIEIPLTLEIDGEKMAEIVHKHMHESKD